MKVIIPSMNHQIYIMWKQQHCVCSYHSNCHVDLPCWLSKTHSSNNLNPNWFFDQGLPQWSMGIPYLFLNQAHKNYTNLLHKMHNKDVMDLLKPFILLYQWYFLPLLLFMAGITSILMTILWGWRLHKDFSKMEIRWRYYILQTCVFFVLSPS